MSGVDWGKILLSTVEIAGIWDLLFLLLRNKSCVVGLVGWNGEFNLGNCGKFDNKSISASGKRPFNQSFSGSQKT